MNLNSLKIKLIGMAALIVITVISFLSWQQYHDKKTAIKQIVENNFVILVRSVVANIESSMKAGHTTALNAILHEAKVHDHIKELRIIDEEGTIIHSADKSDVGKELSAEEREKILNTKQNDFYFTNEKNNFDSYTRILNAPECHGCHSAKKTYIATIEIEMSLDDLSSYINLEKRNTISSAVLMIALILGAFSAFLIFYADRPPRSLAADMRQTEPGFLEASVEEKLTYHNDAKLMDAKFEEQLREIENLNVSLEERVEEVEQANFTIADLAAELEQKNSNLGHAIDRLSTIHKIGLAINSTMDIDRLFNLIVRSTATTLDAQIGYIVLYDNELQELNVISLISNGKLVTPQRAIQMKDTSVSSWVINNRQPLLIADINQTPQFDRFSELGYERKTLICAPLIVMEEIIGTISVVNKTDNSQFFSFELEMLTTIAAQAAIAIKNATLYDEQQQTYLNTIQALVTAIEASDSYTKGHSERVTRYSVEIGRRFNLSCDRMQILERTAILHDIGKIGIDLRLLHKEGKLSAHEISELKRHPEIGMKILEPIEFLKDVRACIGQHHERYDGMGYPKRLKHVDQLIEARIICVADSFDAMTSDRPYRKALSLDDAIAELSENSGTQFDPAVVEIFTSILEEGTFFASRFDNFQTAEQAVSHA